MSRDPTPGLPRAVMDEDGHQRHGWRRPSATHSSGSGRVFVLNEDARSNVSVTLASYEQAIEAYVQDSLPIPVPAYAEFLRFILTLLPAGARMLELGSGPGHDAQFFEAHGVRVQRTDGAMAFVERLRAHGYAAVRRRLEPRGCQTRAGALRAVALFRASAVGAVAGGRSAGRLPSIADASRRTLVTLALGPPADAGAKETRLLLRSCVSDRLPSVRRRARESSQAGTPIAHSEAPA
jgi:hypothetical protein